MVLQKRTPNLLVLLEFHAGGATPKMAINPYPPTPVQSRASLAEPLKKERKKNQKARNETFEEGKVQPSKNQEPPKGSKVAKEQQRKSFVEGSSDEVAPGRHPKVPTWNPSLELDGASLLAYSSIRDSQ